MEGAGACSRNLFHGVCTLCLVLAFLSLPSQGQIQEVTLKDGFSISYYSLSVPGARSISLSRGNHGGKSIVYVSTRGSNVYAVIDDNGDNQPDRTLTVINNRNIPNGIAWRNGSLFVAEVTSVWRYDNVDTHALAGSMFPAPTLVKGDLPGEFEHGWRYIAFGPDGKLYITIGAPCNICDRDGFGTITRMNPDGSGYEMFSKGIRNSVGMDWHPETNELWATDNNRDWMGDNQPDCRLLHAPTKGIDFGFPYCHCNGTGPPELRNPTPGYPIADDVFNAGERQRNCSKYPVCVGAIGPHVAPLGMRFYTGNLFPSAKYNRRTIFVAEHGSWNRPQRIGYRVSAMQLNEQGQVISHEIFANFLQPNYVGWGRPVDVEVLPDGSLVVSDDQRGVLYRITYGLEAMELGFPGLARGVTPPDPVGDVGRQHYVQAVNGPVRGAEFAVWNKTGVQVKPFQQMASFFEAGSLCRDGVLGDPIVVYDHLADRWVLLQIGSGPGTLCVLVSKTADPTLDQWHTYTFILPFFPDYPKLAVGPDAYFVTVNIESADGVLPTSPPMVALDRARMLAGLSVRATPIRYATPTTGFENNAMTPADLDGPPPAAWSVSGTPRCGLALRQFDDETLARVGQAANSTHDFIEVWEMCVDFSGVTPATMTRAAEIAVSEFDSHLCNATEPVGCFPMKGTDQRLFPIHELLYHRVVFRSFSAHDVLLGSFVADADGTDLGSVRWFELRRGRQENATWTLFQEGTVTPPRPEGTAPIHRFLSSVGMDGDHNIVVGYVATGVDMYPSLRYSGRQAWDVPGSLPQGEYRLVDGSRGATTNRFGDYSALTVDPVDNCTFWFTGQYESLSAESATWIAVFRFPSCGQGIPCQVDGECDDGMFCNGAERCVEGLCAPASAEACLGRSCNELREICERPFNELSLSYARRGFGGVPAKPAIAVGSDYMIAITRTEFNRALYQVFTKEPWLPVKQSFLTQFHRSGTACRVGPFPGSGFTAYDSIADRWLIMEVAREATSGTYYLCLLLSLSGVPYGLLYRGYSFALAGDPGDVVLGIMPDAYYFTTGENPPAVYALNRATLLGGRLPTAERRAATTLSGFQRQGLVPAHVHGTPRSGTSCGYFARHIDDELHGASPFPVNPTNDYIEVWYFCPSFATGGPLWGSVSLAVADFNSLLCSGNSDVPCFAQPGSTVQLVPYHEGVHPHLTYRSFASYDVLLLAFTVNVGNNQGGIKWVELRRTNTASHLAWFVYQEGVHSPDTKNRWLGSIAMDSAGNIALGYAAVNANGGVLPGLYFTGRTATAPLGTMTKNETQLVVSGKAAASSLYGGRTMVALDARDGCSFYFDGPWENGTLRSPTYLGVFRFPNCGVCSVDADCDDGLHCTDDKCRDGVCVAEPDPLLCRFGEYCDETLDACVACLDNSHCSNGAFCDGQERCVAGVCQPAATPACGAGQTCLEDQDLCERPFNELSLSYNMRGNGGTAVMPAVSVGTGYMIAITRTGFSRALYQVFTKEPWLPVKQSFLTQFHRSGTACRVGPFPGSGFTAYDSMADRWLIMEVAREATSGTYYLCLLLSLSGVPYGLLYRGYSIALSGNPGDTMVLGVMPDAYYFTTGENPPAVYALNRATLLGGRLPTPERREAPALAGFQRQGLVPAHLHGNARADAACGYFARHIDDEMHVPATADPLQDFIEVWYFCPSFAIGGPQWDSIRLAVADFNSLVCSGSSNVPCFAQPGSTVQLVPFHELVNPHLSYRSFAGHDAMLLAFTVNVGNHQGGIKWVELRRTNTASHLAWFVYQEGVHSPDTKNRWLGSIAMDSAGNIALGYAGVDANNAMLPGLYFTGREVNAPLGTMTKNETQLVVSGKAAASSLYGGRTMVALDARDGCSFYFDGPWENGTLRSPTYLGVFRFPNCGVCSVDTDCDDGLHCTDDKCRDGVCVAEPDPLLCRFGEYCDETLDACVACLDNSHCSNGAFCDGQERCVAGVCQPAATPACSAGQTCLEDQDRCVDCVSDGNCTDNLFCDGAETCVNEVCQAGTPPTCPADQYCSEEVRGCAVCLVDAHCDDSTFCNGVEWCGDGTCWPYPEAETWCGEYVCDEAMDRCVECLTADTCDNGLFCDGVEVCLEDGTCAPGEPPCSDQEVCLEDQQACGDSGGIRTPLWTFVNTSSGAFAVYPSLAMGLDHLVQVVMTNQAAPASSHSAVYTVFDKATGGKLREEQLRLHHSGNCSTSPTGKGYVIYDHLADRWVMAELAVGGTRLCMLLSGDYIPTGSWTAYSFALGSITDSFTLALMPDGYFIGTMEVIPRVYALDRAAMLANAATVTMRTVAVPALPGYALLPQGMDPVTLVGPARVGRPGPCGLFLRVRDDEIHAWLLGEEPNPANDYLEIWRMCPAFANADLASLTLAADVAIAEVDTVVCGNLQQCFWQKGTLAPFLFPYAQGTLHPVAMYRALDSHESLLASLTVDASPPLPEPDPLASQQGGIHWMELRLRATSSMGWYTHQEGLLAPDTKNRFLGALAMDGSGNMLLGYSVTDASTFPSFYYSGRKQKDPLGTMPLGEYPVAVGDAPSPSPSFGARGSVTVDPSGGCMLAMVGSHGDVAGGFASSTSIALLKYSTCVDAGSLQRCGTDDECSDGNYCSGVETCSGPNESCRPGEDPCYVFGESCVAADIPCESFECTMDVDCDNGAYCDGMERCVGERCYPAVVGPCPPTTDCIEASRSCFPHMQAGVRVATNAWATVTLVRSYVSPVVVASLRNAGTNAGAVLLRVRNVTSNSFQVRVQALNGGNLNDELFDFIVMEEGSYAPSQSGGLRIEARKYVTTRVDGSAAVLGFVGEQQTLTGRFSSPVVVGQVMSANDDWSVFYSYIPAPGSSVITTGRHIGARACTSAPACHVPETVGFIVFDATLTSTITGYGASLEAFITGQTVGGASDGPPFNFPFRTPFTNALPGMAIVSVTLHPSDNVVNPGWARMFGLTMSQTEMRLFLDDDQSRSRLTTGLGRISYVAFQY